jgi:adenosine kinase
VESVGTQEYGFTKAEFLARFEKTYGPDATADIEPNLS